MNDLANKLIISGIVLVFIGMGTIAFQTAQTLEKEKLVKNAESYQACLDTQIKLAELAKKNGLSFSIPICYGVK